VAQPDTREEKGVRTDELIRILVVIVLVLVILLLLSQLL
jgi:hypothetical protein